MGNNRQRLADTALARVQTGGLRNLSFRTLADDVGIKSSSVHYHFPEKSDLAQTLIEDYAAAFMQQLADIDTQSRASLQEKLSAYYDIIDAVALSGRFCLCGMLAAELEALTEANRNALEKFFSDMQSWLDAVLQAHQSELSTDLATHSIAQSIVSGMEGALLLDRVYGTQHHTAAQRMLFLNITR